MVIDWAEPSEKNPAYYFGLGSPNLALSLEWSFTATKAQWICRNDSW